MSVAQEFTSRLKTIAETIAPNITSGKRPILSNLAQAQGKGIIGLGLIPVQMPGLILKNVQQRRFLNGHLLENITERANNLFALGEASAHTSAISRPHMAGTGKPQTPVRAEAPVIEANKPPELRSMSEIRKPNIHPI